MLPVEPAAPPTPIDVFGADLAPDLDALAGLGLDGLELPNVLGDIPTLGDPTPPLKAALEGVKTAVAPLNDLLDGLRGVLA